MINEDNFSFQILNQEQVIKNYAQRLLKHVRAG